MKIFQRNNNEIKIQVTNQYDLFNPLFGNREVDQNHLKSLVKSMSMAHLVIPILCNEHMEIIEGQHRYFAAKQLNFPIYYYIIPGYGLKEVKILNTIVKKWAPKDFIKSNCDMGMEDYLQLKEFMEEFPQFPIGSCQILLANKNHTNKSFAKGSDKFSVEDYELSRSNAKKILAIGQYYPGFKKTRFVSSMLAIFKNKNFSFTEFMKKLRKYPTSLGDCATVEQYKLVVENIYNKGRSNKVNLRY